MKKKILIIILFILITIFLICIINTPIEEKKYKNFVVMNDEVNLIKKDKDITTIDIMNEEIENILIELEKIKEEEKIEEEKRKEEERIKEEERKKEELKNIEHTVVSSGGVGIPVLNYHFFYSGDYSSCGESICLSNTKLEEHLKYLSDNGFKTLTMQEFVDWYEGRIEVPSNSVLITIDDGAMGTSLTNGNILIPLLEKYQVHATLFLITSWWDKSEYASPYLDVESHGYNIHFNGSCGAAQLKCLSHDELYNDLKTSMDILGSYKSFCYPFYTSNDNAYNVLSELGVRVAFGGGGYNATRGSYRYYIPRYPIYDSITMDQFINMVN